MSIKVQSKNVILYVTCCLFTKIASKICHVFSLVLAMNNSNNVISQLQIKAGLLDQFLLFESGTASQTNSSVFPSLVLPSPALQTSSPTNTTGESCSQQSTSRLEVEKPVTPAVTYTYMIKIY